MPAFNFSTFSAQNILKQIFNTIPASVSSFNLLIIGNTIIIPLGISPKNTYSAKIAKKDVLTTDAAFSLTTNVVQDGSTVISQRNGDQIRISSNVSIDLFKKLFNFTNQNFVTISVAGIIDAAFQFAYENFKNTNCVLLDSSGIRGAGAKKLKVLDWNRTLDTKDPDKIVLDVLFSFEEEQIENENFSAFEVDEDSINNILLN